jgi:phospholipid transport system substrate-binding protein
MRTFTTAALTFLSTAALAAPLPAPPSATAFVSNLGNQLQSVVGQPAGFRRLFETDFDVSGMSHFVLGRYGRVLTTDEQQQFACYFEDYVTLTFSGKLAQYVGGATFRTIGSREDGNGTTVYSQIYQGASQPMRVDWHLVPIAGTYKVNDVVIDGVSMTMNGRSDLDGAVGRNGGQASSILPVMRQETASVPDHCRNVRLTTP